MVMSILSGVAGNILFNLLKSLASKITEEDSLQKAISRTAGKFDDGDIDNIGFHLKNWIEKDEVQTALTDFLSGHRESIDLDELSGFLVKEVGFYYDQKSNEEATDIINTFLQYLLEEVLKSEHGLLLIYGQIEKVQHLVEAIGAEVAGLNGIREAVERLSMPSEVLIAKADWEKVSQADRKFLEEKNIKPLFLEDSEEIARLIHQLAGEVIHFKISCTPEKPDQWQIITDGGSERSVDVPWKGDNSFGVALMEFARMADKPAADDKTRAELHSYAVRIGNGLGAALLTDEDHKRILNVAGQDGPPMLVTVESDEDMILSLPWELLRIDGQFAVQENRIDLVRSTSSRAANPATLSPPEGYLKLVVNVSAPEGPSVGHLDYEAESYRIVKALHDYSETIFTELGSADDMIDAIVEHKPIGVHFSGHGSPGKLLFEDEEGAEDPISISELLAKIRGRERKLPPFFYLASCHGNNPAKPEEGQIGSSISAAQLHQEGVAQVIGYYGPIVDELSTTAEEVIYRAMANGRTTRYAVKQARAALSERPHELGKGIHRGDARREVVAAFPFAWAQLVFYHRGPDYPLSQKLPEKFAQDQEARLQRSFEGPDERRILSTGFIGRRRELHEFRRKYKDGQQHVFVFQGLGGLGKTTLAFRTLAMLARECPTLTIWCQEVENADNQAQELANRMSEFGQSLFGTDWAEVVSSVDRFPDATEAQRFGFFLQYILQPLDRMVIYLDNMESLLKGPDNEEPKAFGDWRSPEMAQIWDILKRTSKGKLAVMASCRYRNRDFNSDIIHVPEMTNDAIFRMMGWFDGLRRLSVANRARLVGLLHGHPRAVEFLEDLIIEAIRQWEDKRGEWGAPTTKDGIDREWEELIAPALPEVEERLRQNLLLDAIWKNVLDDPCRRMLFRMTLLRRPWDWDLMMQLGEPDEDDDATEKTAQKLRETSLLTQLAEKSAKGGPMRLYQVHPMTAKFVAAQSDEEEGEELEQETYQRVGTYLEKLAETSRDIRVDLDAGHYLFQCGEFDRAYEVLGPSSQYLQEHGMVRTGIAVLEVFDTPEVMEQVQPELCGRLLGTLGAAYYRLGQVEKAMEYHKQALEISEEIGDQQGKVNRLGNLGNAYADLGQVEKAIEYYQQALEIAKEIGHRHGEEGCLGNLGAAYYRLGQVEKAVEYYQQALEIAKEIGDQQGEGNALASLGITYAFLGQFEKAIEYYQQGLGIAKEIGDRRGEGLILGNLGSAYYRLGQFEKAIEYYQQGLGIAKEIGDRRGEGHRLGNLGATYADLGQVEKAREYLEATLAIALEIKDPRMEATALENLEKLG